MSCEFALDQLPDDPGDGALAGKQTNPNYEFSNLTQGFLKWL